MNHHKSSSPLWRRILMLGVILTPLLAGSISAFAQGAGPTPFPNPKDESAWKGVGPIRVFPWMTDNRNYFWTQRTAKQGAVVFIGDSLLGNWDVTAKVKTAQAFPQLKNVANRAIGGDVTRGVLFRLQEDALDLHPEALVILIGSNDLSAKAPIDGIAANITEILDESQKEYPDMPIILCKVPPRNSPQAPIDPSAVPSLNEKITALAQGRKNVTVFDSYTLFGTPDGQPDPVNYRNDLLHPSDDGYKKLGDALSKVFAQLNVK
jgi:lysophospholipase L1-like esterase